MAQTVVRTCGRNLSSLRHVWVHSRIEIVEFSSNAYDIGLALIAVLECCTKQSSTFSDDGSLCANKAILDCNRVQYIQRNGGKHRIDQMHSPHIESDRLQRHMTRQDLSNRLAYRSYCSKHHADTYSCRLLRLILCKIRLCI